MSFHSITNHFPDFPQPTSEGKSENEKQPVLIVGQGLAGSWLSYYLWKSNIPFRVIDNFHSDSASAVAAGLMNPIVPKRLTTTWKSEELFPDFISSIYKEVQEFLQQELYFPNYLIHKIFYHPDDISAWESQRFKTQASWLGPVVHQKLHSNLTPHLGYATIAHSGWVDIPLFIKALQKKLLSLNLLIQEPFDYSQVIESDQCILYKAHTYSKIIFCEGSQMLKNPWFGHLPFNPTKGEELLVYMPDLNLEQVAYAGLHIIPCGNNNYLIGSTFSWDDLTTKPTDWAKEQMLGKLDKLFKGSFEILEQTAGIRPASKDRRPLLGFHPQHPKLGIFNGLGTKGLLLGPLMADYWAKNLLDQKEIDPEIHVNRLFK